ncbi:MAG: DUF3261 domain-containing protein [Azoarcus sp.]|jgi:hypothetical protein|nr:DUF3261 domain-containing protein [Azoarcus sp.]
MRARRLNAAFFFGLCCALCLGGCALLSPGSGGFAPEPLGIAPAVLGEHTVEQRLVIRWSRGERSMDAVLEISADRLRLVMLAFGMRLASLDFDGEKLVVQRFVPHAPEGVRMLNDLLMIAAPLEDLRRALPPGVRVTERLVDGKMRREIAPDMHEDEATKIVVDYETESPWRGKVNFRNPVMGYELVLESHEI